MAKRFIPFEFQIEAADAGTCRVEARFLGSTRSETIPVNPPLLAAREIQQARDWLERGFIDIEYARDFGGRLFQSFFTGEVLNLFYQALERIGADEGLRLLIDLPVPAELAELPWELLYDAHGGNGFLSRSDSVALVRHFTDLPLPHRKPEEGPLRVLLVAASPRDKPAISYEAENEAILNNLKGRRRGLLETIRTIYSHVLQARSLKGLGKRLRQRSLVEFDTLAHATRRSLQNRLLEARHAGRGYHVIHFAGHGESNESGSYLVLENESGGSDLISGEEFAELIDGPAVNLVFINACKSASAQGVVKSVAEWPLRRGIPSVLGMQVPVLDRTAVAFAREFYGFWASGQPLESALGYARRLISREKRSQAADWSIPTLYMGPKEGLTLEMDTPPVQIPRPVRLMRWSFATLISIIGTVTLLLSVPDTATALRKQVPLLRCWYPAEMSDQSKFNVVISEFPVLDENGRRTAGDEGLLLSNFIDQNLGSAFKEIGVASEIRPPVETCPILGTKDERDEKARKLAEAIGANIVIYGVVQKDGDTTYNPEFYVDYLGFEQAGEIIGAHEMGDPVTLPSDFEEGYLRDPQKKYVGRSQALVYITVGLTLYSQDNMVEAARYFQAAHDLQSWSEIESDSGKEVVHLMWGNALARQSSQTVPELISQKISYEEWKNLLEQSQEQYQAALAHVAERDQGQAYDYPRANVGLASVYVTLARGDPTKPGNPFDLSLLDQAENLYGEAAQMSADPELMITTKIHFGRAQIYLARAQEDQRQAQVSQETSQADNLLQQAEENLQLARQEFEETINDYNQPDLDERYHIRIEDLASQANANLAAIHFQAGDGCGAIPYITEAIRLATPYYRARYKIFLGQTYEEVDDIEQAITAYQDAIASIQGDDQTVIKLKDKIKELQNQSPAATPIPCILPTAIPGN